MPDLLIGVVLLVTWFALQFILQPATGWIHVVLIAAVALIIRGIVRRGPGEAR